jgi:segregation and condensation protein A
MEPMDSIEKGDEISDFELVTTGKNDKNTEKITQDQFYDLITNKEASWQAIIYELIQTEQLDPWDIDLSILAKKYLERIKQMEEANFFVSSKVLMAASLLLRIKSEILLNDYLRSLDDVLFGKKEEKKQEIEKIIIDEDELPELIPKTPLPRFRQVTLKELMSALSKAIDTEHRRIKREISEKRAEKLSHVDITRSRINVKDRIRHIYAKISTYFAKKPQNRLSYSELAGTSREDKISAFLPVLHLENQQKIWMEQEKHFDEIWIILYKLYKKQQEESGIKDELMEEIEEVKEELQEGMDDEQLKRIEEINNDFENPLANLFDIVEKNQE